MSDLLLAKPTLPPGFIDVSVGEAHVVRKILEDNFPLASYGARHPPHALEYPEPQGYQPLVQYLEDKYGAPVIITNGAKQALGAVFYSLRKMGMKTVGMRTPYWALIPPLVELHGLEVETEYDTFDSYLAVAPNNPDGFMSCMTDLQEDCLTYEQSNVPMIHDAVYFNHIYLPSSYPLRQFGDVQIYSASKSFGLSGLRVGWVVCPNKQFYNNIKEYMETTTVGVSNLSQSYLHELLRDMSLLPNRTKRFETDASRALADAKEIMLGVSPSVLEIPDDLPDVPGMFLFCKIKDYSLLEKAKINAIDGKFFGAPGYVRMNLAFDQKQITEIVRRLNSVKEIR